MLSKKTLDDLSALLTSDQFTLRGNQLARIVEILKEIETARSIPVEPQPATT